MLTIKVINAIKINIYSREHPPPHFHAVYAEYEELIEIKSLSTYAGKIPIAQRKKVIDCEKIIETDKTSEVEELVLTLYELDYFKSFNFFLSKEAYLTLIFSAKENIFYPLVKKYFDFKDVEIVSWNFVKKSFTYKLISNLNTFYRENYTGTGNFILNNYAVRTICILNSSHKCNFIKQ